MVFVLKRADLRFRIFSGLQAIAEPEKRILLIIGSAHAAILRELIMIDSKMMLIEPREYL